MPTCPQCHTSYSLTAPDTPCPRCGAPPPGREAGARPWYSRWYFVVGLVVAATIVVAVVGALSGTRTAGGGTTATIRFDGTGCWSGTISVARQQPKVVKVEHTDVAGCSPKSYTRSVHHGDNVAVGGAPTGAGTLTITTDCGPGGTGGGVPETASTSSSAEDAIAGCVPQ